MLSVVSVIECMYVHLVAQKIKKKDTEIINVIISSVQNTSVLVLNDIKSEFHKFGKKKFLVSLSCSKCACLDDLLFKDRNAFKPKYFKIYKFVLSD